MNLKERFNQSESKLHQNIGKEDGKRVTGPLRDGNIIPLNQTFKGGTYAGNIPDELLDRGVDSTPDITAG